MTDHEIAGASLGVAVVAGIGTWLGLPQLQGWWKRRNESSTSLSLDLGESSPLPPGPQRLAADRETLSRIQIMLPSTETIQYLRDHSFGNAHRGAFLEPLDHFLAQTGGPEDRFLSRSLEPLRRELRAAVSDFQQLVGKYTFRHVQEDMYEIPGEWERNGSGLYWKAAHEINAAAAEIVAKFDRLVSAARRELIQ